MKATIALFAISLSLTGCVDSRDNSNGPSGCFYKGKSYADQQEFVDDCNQCKCNPEGTVGVGCTQINCEAAKKTCTYKGKVYQDQEEFSDDCNRCKCNDAVSIGVACTQVDCHPCPSKQPVDGTRCNWQTSSKTFQCSYALFKSACRDETIYARCRCESDKWICQQDWYECLPDMQVPHCKDAGCDSCCGDASN